MLRIRNLQMIAKMFLILGIFGCFLLTTTVFLCGKIQFIDTGYSAALDHKVKSTIASTRANRELNAIHGAIADLLLSTTAEADSKADARLATNRNEFVANIDMAEKADASSADELAALKQEVLSYLDRDCKPSIDAGRVATAPQDVAASQALFLKDCAPGFEDITKKFVVMNQKQVSNLEGTEADLRSLTSTTVTNAYIVVLTGLAAVLTAGFFAARSWIARPLGELSAFMGRVATGDLGATVSGLDRRDEFGAMARAVQVFKDAVIEKGRVEGQAATDRQAAEQERVRTEVERQVVARQQAVVVDSLAHALSQLSAGDLTCDLTETFAPDYERLRTDFNAAVTELRGVIGTITGKTSALRSGTGKSPRPRTTCRDGRSSRPPASNRRQPHWTRSPPPSARRRRAPLPPRASSRTPKRTPSMARRSCVMRSRR